MSADQLVGLGRVRLILTPTGLSESDWSRVTHANARVRLPNQSILEDVGTIDSKKRRITYILDTKTGGAGLYTVALHLFFNDTTDITSHTGVQINARDGI